MLRKKIIQLAAALTVGIAGIPLQAASFSKAKAVKKSSISHSISRRSGKKFSRRGKLVRRGRHHRRSKIIRKAKRIRKARRHHRRGHGKRFNRGHRRGR